MKYIFKIAAVALVALLVALQACNNKSELNLDTFTGKATVTGYIEILTYTESADDYLPAVGKTVVVEVANSEYCDGAVGVKYFYGVTDENGKFSIEVPVTNKGVEATVYGESFVYENYLYNEVLNGTSANYIDAVMTTATTKITLRDGDTYYYAGSYTIESASDVEIEMQEVVLKGKLTYTGWKLVGSEFVGTTIPYDNMPFMIYVSTENNLDGTISVEDISLFKGTTDAEGMFKLKVNIPFADNYQFELQVSHVNNNFVHHYYDVDLGEWKTQTVPTLFDGYKSYKNKFYIYGNIVELGVVNVTTTPMTKEQVRGIGNPDVDYDGMTQIYKNGDRIGWKY